VRAVGEPGGDELAQELVEAGEERLGGAQRGERGACGAQERADALDLGGREGAARAVQGEGEAFEAAAGAQVGAQVDAGERGVGGEELDGLLVVEWRGVFEGGDVGVELVSDELGEGLDVGGAEGGLSEEAPEVGGLHVRVAVEVLGEERVELVGLEGALWDHGSSCECGVRAGCAASALGRGVLCLWHVIAYSCARGRPAAARDAGEMMPRFAAAVGLLLVAALVCGAFGCADGAGGGQSAADLGVEAPDEGDVAQDLPPVAPDQGPGDDLADDQAVEDVADVPPEEVGEDVLADVGEDLALDVVEELPPEEDMGVDLPPDPELCGFGEFAAADRDRVVLISHNFDEGAGVGTTFRTMTLTAGGALLDNGARFDVGFRVERMAFVPSGEVALVLGQEGELASVAVRSLTEVEILDTVQLPSADFGDLHITPDGARAFVVGKNVAETSGISTVELGCEGELRVIEEAFFNLRLTESLALLPGKLEAVLLGGQAVFAPVDEDDIRLLRFEGDRWVQVGAFDIFMDFVVASRLGASPDGQQVMVPNGSPFSTEGGQVSVLRVRGQEVTETARLMGLPDAQEARYLSDNQTVLLTQAEPGRVRVMLRDGDAVALQERSFRAGLCEQMASVDRGSLTGTVLVPATNPDGSLEVLVLRLTGPGVLEEVGRTSLGQGFEDIPYAVAVSP
jgi:hypothetical protein